MNPEYHDDLTRALDTLRKGGVIIYPTDTIWGIGCDATNTEAVARVYQMKQRDDSHSMLVLLDDVSYLSFYVKEVPAIAYDIVGVADTPLTIVYDGARNLASNLIASDGSIGIRIVQDAFCADLIRRFRKPIVSTSANISGKPSPQRFDDIDPRLLEQANYVVQWRQDDLSGSKPSSIIKLDSKGHIKILRK